MAIKAVLFDFMGTCLNWHATIIQTLPAHLSDKEKSDFALAWRQEYFDLNAARLEQDLPPEDVDETYRKALVEMLERHPDIKAAFTLQAMHEAVAAWHRQPAWPDVAPAIDALKKRGYEVVVHANGTTRLQLDLCRYSGLQFDMLFSSELLGYIKPDPSSWQKALTLLKLKPEQCVQVAAHAYDTRGAKACGLKTVYVYRWTDDVLEDQEILKKEHNAYLEDMSQLEAVISRL